MNPCDCPDEHSSAAARSRSRPCARMASGASRGRRLDGRSSSIVSPCTQPVIAAVPPEIGFRRRAGSWKLRTRWVPPACRWASARWKTRAADALRERAAAASMYLEGIVSLPRDQADLERFEAEIQTAKRAGAQVVRTVMLSGRRYETFAHASPNSTGSQSHRRSRSNLLRRWSRGRASGWPSRTTRTGVPMS